MPTSPAETATFVAWHRLRAEAERTAGHNEAAARHDAMAEVAAEVLRADSRCQRCGQRLSDPVSVSRGVGPDCARREGPAVAVDADAPVDAGLTRPDPAPSVQRLRERYRTPSQVASTPRAAVSLPSALADVDLPDWRSRAACRGHDPAIFHPVGSDPSAYAQARLICTGCPVREDCLEAHLAEHHGCWGGLSPPERVALRRRRGLLAPRRRPERR